MTHTNCETAPGRTRALRWAAPVFGLLWLWAPTVDFALSDPSAWQGVLVAAGLAAFAPLFLLLRANEALRDARAELAELAVAEERLRFSRDLHDLLGHDLSLIALKAELAGKLLPARVDQAATEVEEIRELTRSALQQVREAVGGYRRPTLPSELAGAKVAFEAAGIDLHVAGTDEPLDPEVESLLAWAVREGATNAIRHSGARRAEITVRPGPVTELEIADDGHGAPAYDGAGHGLTGLRERAQSVGGTIEAGAGPGGGFRVTVRVPAGRSDAPA
jgi:two-component system sensor histidine kinase DesK